MEQSRIMAKLSRLLFPLLAVLTLAPFFSAGMALVLGIATSLLLGNPYADKTRKATHLLLQFSVMGLGAAMDLGVVGQVGFHGIGYTMAGIAVTLFLGTWIGRLLGVARDTSLLLTVGTAICGGSAIAAVAPTIRAKSADVSVALATVFLLNAVALLIFPGIGHYFGLNETQFGLWSALAIHDTSSVVGASMQYGAHALEIATTTKLARALWIVPVTLLIGHFYKHKNQAEGAQKAKRPWFILGFLGAAALVTWVPELRPAGLVVAAVARRSLVLTLFLIGSGITRATLKSVGLRPFLQGLLLWIVVGSATLGAIQLGWIR